MDDLPSGLDFDSSEIEEGTYIFLPKGNAQRAALISWANRPAQQAALEAVRTVTDPDENYMFSLQIGRDKVPSEWAEAGLYIESGYDNLLFDAEYKYLERLLNALFVLKYSNGIAKAEAGEGDQALMDYAAFISLYRLLLERPTAYEKILSLKVIELTGDLMADLVYQYTRPGDSSFTPRGIADAILETDDAVQRFRFRDFNLPSVTEYSVRQAFEWASQGDRNVDPNRFAALMAIDSAFADGLTRFGVFAAVKSMAGPQRDRIDYDKKVLDVFTDYNRRWNYSDLHDPLLNNRSAGSMARQDYPLLGAIAVPQYSALFERRLEMLTALGGMRCALGIVAFQLENNNLPGRLVSIQPRFVRSLDSNLDHMNYNRRIQQPEPLRYWVPLRDESFGPRETPAPYVIKVVFDEFGGLASGRGIPVASRTQDLADAIPFPGFGERGQEFADAETGLDSSQSGDMVGIDSEESTATALTFALNDTSFLLYSVGDNGTDDRAALTDDGTAGDRLFWPPYPSLYREYRNR